MSLGSIIGQHSNNNKMRDQVSIARIETLHPKYRLKFQHFIEDAEKTLNTTFRVAQAFRTFDQQQAIYNQPWDHKDNDLDGKVDESDERVTSAPAGKSFHNYGGAVDLVEMKNGKPNWKFDYKLLAPIAVRHGLEWGGLWKGKSNDQPHFQIPGLDIKKLYKEFLAKNFIPGTQYLKNL